MKLLESDVVGVLFMFDDIIKIIFICQRIDVLVIVLVIPYELMRYSFIHMIPDKDKIKSLYRAMVRPLKTQSGVPIIEGELKCWRRFNVEQLK